MGLTWPLIGRSEGMRTIVAAVSDPELAGILVSVVWNYVMSAFFTWKKK